MTKPEWGTKVTCRSCGASFYDLRRNPAVCPKCDTAHEVARPAKPAKAPAPAPAPDPAPVPDPIDADDAVEDDDDELDDIEDAEMEPMSENTGDLMEDASDLGQDDDDVSEVMEHIDEEVQDPG